MPFIEITEQISQSYGTIESLNSIGDEMKAAFG